MLDDMGWVNYHETLILDLIKILYRDNQRVYDWPKFVEM